MHSKSLIWDYLGKHKAVIDLSATTLKSFFIDDPYVEKIIKDRLYQNGIGFRYYTGDEITKSFLEEQFINLSFFTDAQHFVVLSAELIPIDVINYMFSNELNICDRHVILFFSKLPKSLAEIVKNANYDLIEIETPRIWDGAKILQFCMKELSLNLAYPVQQFILDYLDHSFENFIWVLDLIKLNFVDKVVDVALVKELIQKERYDFFELMDVFYSNKAHYFKILIDKCDDYEWMRQNATSMQNHIVKLLNPEEIKSKSKLSKYDQNLIRWSETNPKNEYQKDLKFFMKLEIESKSKNSFIREIIHAYK